MPEKGNFLSGNLTPSDLLDIFPEARLTMRDRVPSAQLLFLTALGINNVIKEIKYSEAEVTQSILALIAMIPDDIRDEDFMKEWQRSIRMIPVDVRPEFCGVKASFQYCKRRGIVPIQYYPQVNPLDAYHAVYNLITRKNMYLKLQPKEIATGIPAIGDETIEELDDKDA